MREATVSHPQVQQVLDTWDPFQDDGYLAGLRDVRLDEIEVTQRHQEHAQSLMDDMRGLDGPDRLEHEDKAPKP